MRNFLLMPKSTKHVSRLLFLLVFLLGCFVANAQVTTLQNWSVLYNNTATTQQTVSYTVPTGSNSNRVLAVAIASSQTSAGSRTVSISYGGRNLTLATGDMTSSTPRQHTAIYYLNEAGLDLATNSNLVFTVSGQNTRVTTVWAAVFDYVDQRTPLTGSRNYNSGTNTVNSFSFASALTINSGDQAVLVVSGVRSGNTSPRTITYPTNFTSVDEETWTTTDGVRNGIANRTVPTANTNSTCTTTTSGNVLASMTGVAFKGCTPATANAGAALAAICKGGTSAALGGSVGGSATGGTWTSSVSGGTFSPSATNLNATWTPPASFTGAATLTLTSTGGSCGTATASKVLVVNPTPTSVTASASASPVCPGVGFDLTSTGTLNSSTSATVINENFNGTPTGWTTINNSTGGTPASAAWTLRANGYTRATTTYNSNDASQFYLSDSDNQGTGSTTATILQSPAFSTIGMTAATLRFFHFYRDYDTTDAAVVEISTDGTNWTALNTFTTTQGASNAFVEVTTSLSGYLNQPSVSIRFKYDAVWAYYWAIDNVTVTGTYPESTYSWTSTPAGFTSSVQNPTGVTQSVATVYTVNYTNAFGCSASASTTTVQSTPATVGGTVSGSTTVCAGAAGVNLTLSGHVGTILRWESAVSPFTTWTPITNTTTTLNAGSLSETTRFRAILQSGACAQESSSSATITVTAAVVAGEVTGSTTVCTGANSGLLTLTGHSGTIIRWERSVSPFTTWTPITNTTATYTSGALTATTKFRAVLQNGSCTAVTSTEATIEVSPLTVGGAVSGTATICSGTSADLTLSGHVGNVIRWESAVSPFTTWTPIANTTTTHNTGALSQETKFRAVVQSGACSQATSSEATLSFASTTWNGTSWVGGAPAANKSLIIAANYTSPGSNFDLQGCSLTVQNNAVVTIVPQDTVILSGALTVATGSTMTFEAQAHLIQSGTTNQNSGNVVVKANSSPIKRLDYTLWSAPVAGQQLQAFSPLTLANRFYDYDSNTNFYTVVASPSTSSFEAAKGVLIRVANNHSASQPQAWTGTFTGVPNNGTYTIPLANFGPGKRFTLVGNPYASPIDPEAFITNANNAASITGTLYLWRKTNGSNKPSYCTFNLGGFITNGEERANQVANLPYQVIQTGQGFFVEGTGAGSGNVVFDNTMRVDDHTNSFLRTANTAHTTNSVERNRVWLNVTNEAGLFSQAMIGYVANATNGFDLNYDGKYINDGEIALASVLDAEPYAIQCKALPFSATDVIPMQFTVTTAGTYSIAIDRVDGLFASGQNVYLRDTVTGTVHNLSEGAYSFATDAGTFNARFEVVFQSSTLGVTDPVLNENQVVIYKTQSNEISINTGNFVMDNVMIYDLAGRLLFQQKDINDSQTVIKVGFATEVLLVKIKTQDGKSVTKKVLFPRTTLKKDIKISTIQVAEDE